MTLRKLSKIEFAVIWSTGILILPFAIMSMLVEEIRKSINWVIDARASFCHMVGNKLMLCFDEVRDGKIKTLAYYAHTQLHMLIY